MNKRNLQYVSDEKGDLAPRARQAGRIAVIVPIELWEELTSENEIDATEELLSIAGFERGSPRRRRAQGQVSLLSLPSKKPIDK